MMPNRTPLLESWSLQPPWLAPLGYKGETANAVAPVVSEKALRKNSGNRRSGCKIVFFLLIYRMGTSESPVDMEY